MSRAEVKPIIAALARIAHGGLQEEADAFTLGQAAGMLAKLTREEAASSTQAGRDTRLQEPLMVWANRIVVQFSAMGESYDATNMRRLIAAVTEITRLASTPQPQGDARSEGRDWAHNNAVAGEMLQLSGWPDKPASHQFYGAVIRAHHRLLQEPATHAPDASSTGLGDLLRDARKLIATSRQNAYATGYKSTVVHDDVLARIDAALASPPPQGDEPLELGEPDRVPEWAKRQATCAPDASSTGLGEAVAWRYFKGPFRAVERNNCYYVEDSHPSCRMSVMMKWPTHPGSETVEAERETWRLAELFAAAANNATPSATAAVEPLPNWCRTCGKRPNDPKAIFCSDSFHVASTPQPQGVWTQAQIDEINARADDLEAKLPAAPQPQGDDDPLVDAALLNGFPGLAASLATRAPDASSTGLGEVALEVELRRFGDKDYEVFWSANTDDAKHWGRPLYWRNYKVGDKVKLYASPPPGASRAVDDAIARYDAAAASIGTCGDGACVVKRPMGMHTNGGCRCADDKLKARRMMEAARQLRAALNTPSGEGKPSPE